MYRIEPKRARHASIVLLLLIVEILIATTFSGIVFLRAYVGDFLVVILLYHLGKIFFKVPPPALAVAVFLLACVVEGLQYLHIADVLGIPPGSFLSILVGTRFSWADVLAYFLGCLAAYGLDAIGSRNRNPVQ